MTINTTYHQNEECHIVRIIQTIENVAEGFFSSNNYFIVTKPFFGSRRSVVLPPLTKEEYSIITKTIPTDFTSETFIRSRPILRAKKVLQKVVKKYPLSINQKQVDATKIEWEKKQHQFAKYFEQIFHPKVKHTEINIYFSPYGTGSTFYGKVENDVFNLTIRMRDDREASSIAYSIISIFFRPELTKKFYTWSETQSMTDFILSETILKNLFPEFEPIMYLIRTPDVDTEMITMNAQYLANIEYEYIKELSCDDREIFIKGKIPTVPFTKSEIKILQLLLGKEKQICSYLDIGAVLWEREEDFSIWAISRMIFKIRNKLKQNGLDPNKLKTYRGRGFIIH